MITIIFITEIPQTISKIYESDCLSSPETSNFDQSTMGVGKNCNFETISIVSLRWLSRFSDHFSANTLPFHYLICAIPFQFSTLIICAIKSVGRLAFVQNNIMRMLFLRSALFYVFSGIGLTLHNFRLFLKQRWFITS